MTTNTTNPLIEPHIAPQYKGPYKDIVKLLLNFSSSIASLERLVTDFLSSQRNASQDYDFTSGFMLFYMFHYTSFMKIASKDVRKKEKVEWVRRLIQVFLKQEFLGVICLGGLLKGYQMIKPQSKRHIIGDLIAEVEDALLASIDAQIDFIKGDQSLDLIEAIQCEEDSRKEIITYICGQCFPSIPPSQMAKLKSKEIVLRIVFQVEFGGSRVFNCGAFINRVIDDMRDDEGKLTRKWTKSTPSYKSLHVMCSGVLFKEQSKISLGMSKLVQVVEKEDISILLSDIYFFSHLLFLRWELCPLSLIEGGEYLEGFPGHKKVFRSVLDRILDDETEPTFVLMNCKPLFGKNTPTQRNRITYYLLVTENLMKVLDDNIVEHHVLPFINPYLQDNSDILLFESAHSAILGLFSNMKRVANELALFYCNLLLESYPKLIHVSQLRVAYTTVIESLSCTDSELTSLCLNKLIKRIEDTPISVSTPASNVKNDDEIQTIASYLNRGHLLLTLIDQAEQDGIGKQAIKKALFNALSTGLDYTKKDTGVKWWLSEGSKI
ncbi:21699_t:CDS:2 [Cetraspora pellucida]|uniref:21699_t:CDS:1 n=1 Tax=Cetraspora pellucida TaxID=1433469 RepID=A0A9N8ZED7_9GLOM|nr:21699_t:CDS:2 [Cetraspora pellucida]